ncbi:MAG: hypothetical protein J0L77_07995 [Alphaproteobacteria bacterium]|nr:hypothetical protein [Alphaproteobacteria bacterium]
MAQNAPALPTPIQDQISRQCAQGGYSAYILFPDKGGAQEVSCFDGSMSEHFLRGCKRMQEHEILLADTIHDIRRQLSETKDQSIGFWSMDVDREEAEKDILPKMESDLKLAEDALKEMYKDPVQYGCPLVG